MKLYPVSAIGKCEYIRYGDKVCVAYNATFDEFTLIAIGRQGQGQVRELPCWSSLYREAPKATKAFLLRNGAQIAISQLSLLI